MVRGEEYTVESDYWSVGILLYAMVFGELPFEDENTQRLLHKIIYDDIDFPSGASPQLQDFLSKLLVKEPRERLTLKKIKEHPWFSQNTYSVITEKIKVSHKWKIAYFNGSDDKIDSEIVQKMTDFGYNCQSLLSSMLNGEINHMTAVYRMLKKDKVTDLMKDLNQKQFHIHEPFFSPAMQPFKNNAAYNQNSNLFKPKKPPLPLPLPITGRSPRNKTTANFFLQAMKHLDENIPLSDKLAYDSISSSARISHPQPPTLLESVGNVKKTLTRPSPPPLQRRKKSNSLSNVHRHSIGAF